MYPNTRMVRLGPTLFFFHHDLSGEVALTDDDEPVLCQKCSDDQVKAGVMRRLGEASQDEQCRLCGRWSWGRIDGTELRPSILDGAELRHIVPTVAPALMLDVLARIADEEQTRLDDLGDPPVDPHDAEQIRERLDVLSFFKAITAHLVNQVGGNSEGLRLLAELTGIVREVAHGYGDENAPDAPYTDILRRADAYLAAARFIRATP
jgi:hypothetical protein